MDTQPKIPTLKDSQKPQVKIRGLEAGVTLFDRLKQFKKKDLAFILAGLGTLFMAPLAEHFMMSPESGDGTLQAGYGKGGSGGRGMFGSDGSSSPYDPGTSNLAPGGAVGGGSDIITPLNVRDPSALVMGPGATQQPPTQSVMPATPPPTAPVTRSDSDLKDALAASARGVGAAAHAAKALLPVPKVALAGSGGLRGLGVVSGGTSATAGGGGISSNGLAGNKAAGGNNMPGVRGGNNIKSVSRSATGGGSGNDAALKAAGDAAAGMFNKGGSAFQSATDAANTAIPAGGGSNGGAGAGGSSANDKPFGGDQNKDGKNVGESLAFLKQKAMQEAQIALWAKEQEAGDNKLEALKIRNSMAEAFTSKLAGMAADQVGCMINSSSPNCPTADSAVSQYYCTPNGGGAPVQIPAAIVAKDIGKCLPVPGGKDGAGATSGKVYYPTGSGLAVCPNGGSATPYTNCTTNLGGGPGGSSTPQQNPIVDGLNGGITGMTAVPQTDLGPSCAKLAAVKAKMDNAPSNDPGIKSAYTTASKNIASVIAQAAILVQIRDAVGGSAPATGQTNATAGVTNSGECQAAAALTLKGGAPVSSQLNSILNTGNSSLLLQTNGVVDRMKASVTAVDLKAAPDLNQLKTDVGDDKSGLIGNIANYTADVGTLRQTYGKVDASMMSAPDPVGVAALQAALGKNTDQATVTDINNGVKSIQGSYSGTGRTITNLETAANTNLAPVVPLLKGSVGDKGTLAQLRQNNSDLDNIGGAPGMKVTPPLTAPTLTAPAAAPKPDLGTMNTDLTKAQTDIKTAAPLVKNFTPATPPDTACANAPCKPAQDALNQAGTDVATIRADQSSINNAISQGATAAGQTVGLAPKP